MLYVVHCIDTEGPLDEKLEATFERLRYLYGLDLEPDPAVLARLQTGTYEVGDPELRAAIMTTFGAGNLAYMRSWDQLTGMLDRLDGEDVRLALPDSDGNGWLMNWHCVSHHGFDPAKNPRCRDLSMHGVFDRYRERVKTSRWRDGLHWHFHPVPRSRQANHSATAYFTSPEIFEIISRRVLERGWFPCVNRPGFHSERPDSHWFLEQWIPFDYANARSAEEAAQTDQLHGRFSDWRRAPDDWSVYHPHHDDYQVPGLCRRAIGRCLYLGGRVNRLRQEEVHKAFAEAREEDCILSMCSHDFRDLTLDVAAIQEMLRRAARDFPDVAWRYEDGARAMRAVLGLAETPPARFELSLEAIDGEQHLLTIRSDQPPFGPQPWFCCKMRDGAVWHDNLDIGNAPLEWTYTFDEQTARLKDLERIGVAMNTASGRTTVTALDPATGRRSDTTWND